MKSGHPLSVFDTSCCIILLSSKASLGIMMTDNDYDTTISSIKQQTFCSYSPYFRPNTVTSAGPRTAQAVARSGSDGPGAART